jgi:hypothetical protein
VAEFAELIKPELETWGAVVKTAGLTPNYGCSRDKISDRSRRASMGGPFFERMGPIALDLHPLFRVLPDELGYDLLTITGRNPHG